MKKVLLAAVLFGLAVGVAYAGSISIPWFVDKADALNSYDPPNTPGHLKTVVFLHNNGASDLECTIEYFKADGSPRVFASGVSNTFLIPARATIAFRPAADDPGYPAGTYPGGLEQAAGRAVPNCSVPSTTGTADAGNIYTGSAVVTYPGLGNLVSGMVRMSQKPPTASGNSGASIMWGSALPAGID